LGKTADFGNANLQVYGTDQIHRIIGKAFRTRKAKSNSRGEVRTALTSLLTPTTE